MRGLLHGRSRGTHSELLASPVLHDRAVQIMVEKWKIKPDVAGATFMAASRFASHQGSHGVEIAMCLIAADPARIIQAGGSAPELFTSLVGATIDARQHSRTTRAAALMVCQT